MYSLNFISSLCKLRPNLSFAAVLTTVASDADLKNGIVALKALGCINLDILVLDPFRGSSRISFHKAVENLRLQLDALRCQGVVVLSPFEKHQSVISFPFSSQYKQIGILYDLIPLQYQRDLLISNHKKSSYMWSLKKLSKFDLLFAISKEVEKNWRHEFALEPTIKVIYGGGGHLKNDGDVQSFKDRSGILCVSAEQPHKNLSRLIESYSLLPEHVQLNHDLTIVGVVSSGARKRFTKLARKASGRVLLTEYLNDTQMKDRYRQARLLIMPSLVEGLSLPILEAWSNGLVAIGSKETVAEELIKNNSLLFDPYSSVDMSKCIELFLTSEQSWNIAYEALVSSAAFFTWEKTGTLATKEIESLLDV